jgi:hypothetical protein
LHAHTSSAVVEERNADDSQFASTLPAALP